jgi:hypothetical protein
MKPCPHRHGDRRRYSPRQCHKPCRCAACSAAQARYDSAYHRDRLAGVARMVDAAATRMLLTEWRETGIGTDAVARASGLRASHISRIARGSGQRILAVTAELIAAAAPELTWANPTTSARQLRALAVAGFALTFLASEIDTSRRHLAAIASGGPDKITARLAARIDATYERLYAEEGNSVHARNRALAKGWHPAEAWTDETIGNPEARPWAGVRLSSRDDVDTEKVDQMCAGRHFEKVTLGERLAAVRILTARGLNDRQIADRIGSTDRTVLRIRHRNDINAVSGYRVLGDAPSKMGTAAEHIDRLTRQAQRIVGSHWKNSAERADARTSLADLAVAALALEQETTETARAA